MIERDKAYEILVRCDLAEEELLKHEMSANIGELYRRIANVRKECEKVLDIVK